MLPNVRAHTVDLTKMREFVVFHEGEFMKAAAGAGVAIDQNESERKRYARIERAIKAGIDHNAAESRKNTMKTALDSLDKDLLAMQELLKNPYADKAAVAEKQKPIQATYRKNQTDLRHTNEDILKTNLRLPQSFRDDHKRP